MGVRRKVAPREVAWVKGAGPRGRASALDVLDPAERYSLLIALFAFDEAAAAALVVGKIAEIASRLI